MSLAKPLIQTLRQRGHKLRPVVRLGNQGLTEGVLKEIDLSLAHHELMKIRLGEDRETRAAMVSDICQRIGAELVQSIGRVALLYRPKEAASSAPAQSPAAKRSSRPRKPAATKARAKRLVNK